MTWTELANQLEVIACKAVVRSVVFLFDIATRESFSKALESVNTRPVHGPSHAPVVTRQPRAL